VGTVKRLLEAIDSVPTVAVVTVFAASVVLMDVGLILTAVAAPSAATSTLVTGLIINMLLLLTVVVGNLDRGGKR